MVLLAAHLACILLTLTGVRLAVPETYHTIKDAQHAACLRRIDSLELALGMRETPYASTAVAKAANYSGGIVGHAVAQHAAMVSQFNAAITSGRWARNLSTATPKYQPNGSDSEWDAQVKRWEAESRKNIGKPPSADEALRAYYLTRR